MYSSAKRENQNGPERGLRDVLAAMKQTASRVQRPNSALAPVGESLACCS